MTAFDHIPLRTIAANGLNFRIADYGTGPVVLLLHGWPESWYSWRHQILALAGAGYRAIAPDMRGYGGTDAPEAVEDYAMPHLIADVVGLVDAIGEDTVHLVGHDFGSIVGWQAALFHPDRFRTLSALSVPYIGRPARSPIEIWREQYGDHFYYILYHQEPGVAEAEYDADPRGLLERQLISPDTPKHPPEYTDPKADGAGWIPRLGKPKGRPPWLTAEDLDYYVAEFTRTGFRGGVNYYRNFHRNWELMPEEATRKIEVPTIFLAGEKDPVIRRADPETLRRIMAGAVPTLEDVQVYGGAGHWIQQERANEVNDVLIAFLGRHSATG